MSRVRTTAPSWRGPRWAIVAASLLLLCFSVTATCDTYNFYFEPKKKGQEPGAEAEQAAPQPAPPATPAQPAPQAPAPASSAPGTAPQPIVIHNNNNFGSPVPPQAAPSGPLTTVATESGGRSPFRLGIGALLSIEEFRVATVNQGRLDSYRRTSDIWGGLLTLGYDFTRGFRTSVFGGVRSMPYEKSSSFLAGLDLEFVPFRIAANERWDVFELGLLVGASTIASSRDGIGSLHGGARINVNMAERLGITLSGRANLGHITFEAGFITRL